MRVGLCFAALDAYGLRSRYIILLMCLLPTAMPFSGNRLLSNSNQAGKANPFQYGLRQESGNLELVGTIKSPGQTRHSMSWSSDDRYLATSTGESVSVWKLPRKDLHQVYKNIDARSTKSEDEEPAKVGRTSRR